MKPHRRHAAATAVSLAVAPPRRALLLALIILVAISQFRSVVAEFSASSLTGTSDSDEHETSPNSGQRGGSVRAFESEGGGRHRRRRPNPPQHLAPAIRPEAGVEPTATLVHRAGGGGVGREGFGVVAGAAIRVGRIDVSDLLLGDVMRAASGSAPDFGADEGAPEMPRSDSSIRVQLFADEPSMTFRVISSLNNATTGSNVVEPSSGGSPPGRRADGVENSAGIDGGGGLEVRTLHAEDVSDDGGYTMSIVSISTAPAGDEDSSGARRMYMAGSVVTNGIIYDISRTDGMEEGMAMVQARRVEDLPREADPILLQGFNYSSATVNASLREQSTADADDDSSSRELRRNRGRTRVKTSRTTGPYVLDVMVIYTANAMCAQSGEGFPCENTPDHRGHIEARIILAVEETNIAFELSGVQGKLRLVRMHLVENVDDSDRESWPSMLTLLDSLRYSTGGFESVRSLRDSVGADFVSLVTERIEWCGLAPYGPSPDSAHSIVSRVCSTGYYSFGHELGHNFGCDHNPGNDIASTAAFAKGYRSEVDGIRTILGFRCKSAPCTRVIRFSSSSSEYSFNGMKIGDAGHDNARQINRNLVTMSRYRPTKVSDIFEPIEPTHTPTAAPTAHPSDEPTTTPTFLPSLSPSYTLRTADSRRTPTIFPSSDPSVGTSSSPSQRPSPTLSSVGEVRSVTYTSSLPSSMPSSTSQSPSAVPTVPTAASGQQTGRPTSHVGPHEIIKPAVGALSTYGNQFDLRARSNPIRILGFAIHTSKKSSVQCEVWTRSGSHVDARNTRDGRWTKIQDVSVVGSGSYSLTALPLFSSPVAVSAGSLQSFTVVLKQGGIACSPGISKGTESIANDDLVIYEGSYISSYYGVGVAGRRQRRQPRGTRIWEGAIWYDVESSTGINPDVSM